MQPRKLGFRTGIIAFMAEPRDGHKATELTQFSTEGPSVSDSVNVAAGPVLLALLTCPVCMTLPRTWG